MNYLFLHSSPCSFSDLSFLITSLNLSFDRSDSCFSFSKLWIYTINRIKDIEPTHKWSSNSNTFFSRSHKRPSSSAMFSLSLGMTLNALATYWWDRPAIHKLTDRCVNKWLTVNGKSYTNRQEDSITYSTKYRQIDRHTKRYQVSKWTAGTTSLLTKIVIYICRQIRSTAQCIQATAHQSKWSKLGTDR